MQTANRAVRLPVTTSWAALATARADALAEAAKAVCRSCELDIPLSDHRPGLHYHATDVWCDAGDIHEMLAAETHGDTRKPTQESRS